MDLPDSMRAIVAECAQKHGNDIDLAVRCAVQRWRKEQERDEWLDAMEESQLRNMIADWRHHRTTATKRLAGEYGVPAKVAGGAANRIAGECLLDSWYIGGARLNDMLGEQLLTLAKQERVSADGHVENARMCEALATEVGAGKTVRQCVSDKRARQIFQSLSKPKKITRAEAKASFADNEKKIPMRAAAKRA